MHHVTLRDYSTTFKQYRHLIDGGVTDNLGVQTLVETFAAHVQRRRARGEPDPYPHGAVIIVLDATDRSTPSCRTSRTSDFIESLVAGAGLTSTSLLNRVEFGDAGGDDRAERPDDVAGQGAARADPDAQRALASLRHRTSPLTALRRGG